MIANFVKSKEIISGSDLLTNISKKGKNVPLSVPSYYLFQCDGQSGGGSKMPNEGFPLLYIW